MDTKLEDAGADGIALAFRILSSRVGSVSEADIQTLNSCLAGDSTGMSIQEIVFAIVIQEFERAQERNLLPKSA